MKPNALIIEDDVDTARLLGLLLDRNGWQFEHVLRLADGVKRANSHPFPEIILLDLQLPDSMAEQTVARIPDLMRNGPVLVLSNYQDHRLIDTITGMGAHFAKKEVDGPGTVTIFDGVMQACEGWRKTQHAPKKATAKIDLNLLQMAAILSKHGNVA